MVYGKILPGIFQARPNRFIAHVEIADKAEICHVKNTGRCKELLQNGAMVYCAAGENPKRKTKFDLIAVEKGEKLINMDSQAPNRCAAAWLEASLPACLLYEHRGYRTVRHDRWPLENGVVLVYEIMEKTLRGENKGAQI